MKNMDDFPVTSKTYVADGYPFRKMSADDLPRVLAIERTAYDFPWSETIFKDCLRVNYHCYVVEQGKGGAVQGYAIMTVAAGEAHILNLCLDQSLRSKGIGRSLLAHLIDDARRYRADTILLEVRASNVIAIELYLNTGFNEAGRRNGYYPSKNSHGREDALILARVL